MYLPFCYDIMKEKETRAKRHNTLALSQLVKDRDITEELKAANSLLWIQEMNNAKQNAEEIVLNEIIYL